MHYDRLFLHIKNSHTIITIQYVGIIGLAVKKINTHFYVIKQDGLICIC